MSVEVQHRRGTRTEREAITLAAGEFGYDQTLGTIAAGDGATAGGILMGKWGKRKVVVATALAADTDDYAPTDLSIAEVLVLSSDADYNITGLTGGVADRVLTLVNRGDYRLTLTDQDAASTAGNRFDFGFDLVLRSNQAVTLYYDADALRWAIKHIGLFTVTDLPEDIAISGIITPSQITATQDDYAPPGQATATVWRLSSDASRNITGIAASGANRLVVLFNAGNSPIVLQDENSNSTAANRFSFGADVTIAAKQAVVIWKDGTLSRWVLLAAPSTGSSGSVPSDLPLLLGQLAMQIADTANVAEFLGDTGNRFADSFDALTYVDTGAATNLDTSTAGLLKPTKTAATNVLTGGTASASQGTAPHDASAAVDGSTSTYWQTTSNQESSGWWQYDFGAGNEKKIAKIRQYWNGSDSGIQTANIKVSATGAFAGEEVTVASGVNFGLSGGAGWYNVTYTPPSTAYRYLRIYSLSTVNTANAVRPIVYEFQAMESDTPNNVVVASTALTAAAAPSSGRLVARVKEIDSITPNVDLIFAMSRDGGTTWTNFAVTKKFTANDISVYESDTLDVSGQPSGTLPKWRLTSANNKDFELRDIYFYWT